RETAIQREKSWQLLCGAWCVARALFHRGQLVEQDLCADADRLQTLHARELQDARDFASRRARLERAADVAAYAGRVEPRIRGVERDADELDRLPVERTGDRRRDRHRDHFLGPCGIELREGFPFRVPVAV